MPAHATTITNPDDLQGIDQYREWIAQAEGVVPLPQRVEIIEGAPCGPGGCAFPLRNPPAISLDYTPWLWGTSYEAQAAEYNRDRRIEQTIFIHELGHIWDLERGAWRNRWRGYREEFRRIMGHPQRRNHKNRWLSRQMFYEGWADAYARCVTGTVLYGFPATRSQTDRICNALREET